VISQLLLLRLLLMLVMMMMLMRRDVLINSADALVGDANHR